MGHVSAVTGFAFTRLPLKEGFCILAFGSHNKSYWIVSELRQNKFPLKVSKQSVESFCYTLLDSSNKRQYYLSSGEEAPSMFIYSKNMLLTQPRMENVAPTVNPLWILGCCFFLHALKLTVAQRSSTTCGTAAHMMWLTCCRILGHSKIPAVQNLKDWARILRRKQSYPDLWGSIPQNWNLQKGNGISKAMNKFMHLKHSTRNLLFCLCFSRGMLLGLCYCYFKSVLSSHTFQVTT